MLLAGELAGTTRYTLLPLPPGTTSLPGTPPAAPITEGRSPRTAKSMLLLEKPSLICGPAPAWGRAIQSSLMPRLSSSEASQPSSITRPGMPPNTGLPPWV